MAPTCLRPLLRYRSFAILFLTPLLLLPLPLAVPARVSVCGSLREPCPAPSAPGAPTPPAHRSGEMQFILGQDKPMCVRPAGSELSCPVP